MTIFSVLSKFQHVRGGMLYQDNFTQQGQVLIQHEMLAVGEKIMEFQQRRDKNSLKK